jgi:hypothetical protein
VRIGYMFYFVKSAHRFHEIWNGNNSEFCERDTIKAPSNDPIRKKVNAKQ